MKQQNMKCEPFQDFEKQNQISFSRAEEKLRFDWRRKGGGSRLRHGANLNLDVLVSLPVVYNIMASSQESIVYSEVPHPESQEIAISNDIFEIMRKKIENFTIKRSRPQQIELSSNHQESVQLVSNFYFEDSKNFSDEEYQPEGELSENESVNFIKIHNLRSKDLTIITKQQFIQTEYSPPFLTKDQPIVIQDSPPPAPVFKMETIKTNFKEEMRGPVTKKTKIQFLRRTNQLLRRNAKTVKIQKQLKKLAKQLS